MADSYRNLPPDVRRLMGLDRNFSLLEGENKRRYLFSDDRINAYDDLDAFTGLRKAKIEQKKGIIGEILKNGLLSEEVLKNYSTVYLGSCVDIEYPLTIGARDIVLVDPGFVDPKWKDEVVMRLRKITKLEPVVEENLITASFDFGKGKETIRIVLVSKFFALSLEDKKEESYKLPDQTGNIILFASQGPDGAIGVSEEMKKRVVSGGTIIADDCVYVCRDGSGTMEKIQLGSK